MPESRWLLPALVAYCAVVFLLDLVFPIGVASAVPYVLGALAALWLPSREQRSAIAILGTGLAALGFFFPLPSGAVLWIGLQNRLIAILAIWTTLYLGNLIIRRTDELRDREARLRTILDAAVDAIITADRGGTIRSCNPAAEMMFGYPAADLIGRNLTALVPGMGLRGNGDGPEAASSLTFWEDPGGVQTARRRDGSTFPAAISLSQVLTDELREFTSIVAIVRDVSDLVAAQERAIQAERLAAIGQTIAALSHESRNELHTLGLAAELLGRRLAGSPDLLSLVGRLRESQDRLLRLFEDVRGFAAPVVLELAECCVSDIWQRAWHALAGSRAGRDAVLLEETEAVDLTCVADEFRLEQVFRNLFENSLSACGDPLRMEIRCVPAEINDEPGLAVTVRDNGPGIPADVRKRIFEPFFTTKSGGTGLGMAIARRSIEAHGGTMDLGDCRAGAEFHIVLPRQAAGPPREAAPAAERERAREEPSVTVAVPR